MEYRTFGNTGLRVSSLALGTVELGVEYGIRESEKSNRPGKNDALDIIGSAVDMGINLFDTAPNYGASESLLGEAIGNKPECYIATKVSIPQVDGREPTGADLKKVVLSSIEDSLRALRRETIDIIQIHNATAELIKKREAVEVLLRAKEDGKVRFTGASLYGEEAALAAVKDGSYDVIQVAYSMLDQRMAGEVLPLAREAGVGVMNRSALLKGVLTSRARYLPDELSALRYASEKIISAYGISWDDLPERALRFCLSSGLSQTVLVGVNSRNELQKAVKAASEDLLDDHILYLAKDFAIDDERLINPSYWSIA